MTKKPQRYIDAINEIEQIITEIENNELDVYDLTEKIRRASELLKFCKTKLRATEEEIQKIISDFEEDS